MRIFAYCAKGFEDNVRWASTVNPVTCPPVTAETFDLSLLEGNDLISFNLHGREDIPSWFGGGTYQGDVAITADQIKSVDFGQSVIFVAGCNLFYNGQQSPMLDALIAANAGWIIGGGESNFTTIGGAKLGADLLGFGLVRFMRLGIGIDKAFHFAKQIVRIQPKPNAMPKESYDMVRDDTLAFQLIKGAKDNERTIGGA